MEVKSGKADLFHLAQEVSSPETKISTEATTTVTLAPEVVAEKKAPVDTGKSIKAEIQISASATQARLRNQLELNVKADFAQKKLTNNPVLQDATAERGQVRGGRKVEFLNHFPFFKVIPARHEWNDFNYKHIIPRFLSTGNSDDRVDIQMEDDGRVHVKVNDKEAWSGTLEEFKNLTIDTGGGNDVVNNTVDGATITTGEGNDVVVNQASGTNIDTGRGEDVVRSAGTRNIIGTGSGKDVVRSEGDLNEIRTGDGDDTVWTKGEDNKVWTGLGVDTILGSGDNNTLSGGDDQDRIGFQGNNNSVWAGSGYDIVSVEGNRNRIHGQDGVDTITLNGSNNAIDAGEQDDQIKVSGNLNWIQGKEGGDTITIAGDQNTIEAGSGVDTVNVEGNHNRIDLGAGIDRYTIGQVTGEDNTYTGTAEDTVEELSLPVKDLLG